MCNPEENIFYVYVYLDPMKPGHYVYGEYEFDYKPFYVGKGKAERAYDHLCECYNKHFGFKIKKIQRITGNDPIILLYKENMVEDVSYDLEVMMVATIGRYDKKKGPLCNHTDAGEGGRGRIVSDETRKKISLSKIGKKHPHSKEAIEKIRKANTGRELTEEWKKKIGIGNKGKVRSEETRKKISEAHKGITPTKETLTKLSAIRKGTKRSDETKRKMSEKSKGRVVSDETRKKISDALKGRKLDEETRKKMSMSQKKKVFTEEHKRNISKAKKRNNKDLQV